MPQDEAAQDNFGVYTEHLMGQISLEVGTLLQCIAAQICSSYFFVHKYVL
jgi:hypothetical protein